MKNKISEGLRANITNGSGGTLAAGTYYHVGSLGGVAVSDVPNGAEGVFHRRGVFALTKQAAADVFAVGDIVSIENSNWTADTSAAGDAKIGVCVKASANGDTTVATELFERPFTAL